MTDLRAWSFLDQHLAPDAVVALVDGELSAGAQDRASSHLARCPFCAAEVAAQRQASSAVRGADTPEVSSGLLASLMAIPQEVELPDRPDGLALTPDGQLVAVLKPTEARQWGLLGGQSALGSGRPLGSTDPLGSGSAVLGESRRASGRRGAGIVVSGLVLGALALSFPSTTPPPRTAHPGLPGPNVGSASLRIGDQGLIAPANDARPVGPAVHAPLSTQASASVSPSSSMRPSPSVPVSVSMPVHPVGQ